MASAFMSRAILGLYSCVLAVLNSNEILLGGDQSNSVMLEKKKQPPEFIKQHSMCKTGFSV